jgi:hypothetical protein
MVMMKKSKNLDFQTWPNGPRPKSRNSNKRHDGILSIGNFMLMICNHFALFQLPGNLFRTKKNVLPISVAKRYFLFIRGWKTLFFYRFVSFLKCYRFVSFRFLKFYIFFVPFRFVSQTISFRFVPFLIFFVSFFPFRFLNSKTYFKMD